MREGRLDGCGEVRAKRTEARVAIQAAVTAALQGVFDSAREHGAETGTADDLAPQVRRVGS